VQLRQSGGCEMSPSKLGRGAVEAREARRWQGYRSGYPENARPNDSDARRASGPETSWSLDTRIPSPVAVDQSDDDGCATSSS
jgi:hypothetical protein